MTNCMQTAWARLSFASAARRTFMSAGVLSDLLPFNLSTKRCRQRLEPAVSSLARGMASKASVKDRQYDKRWTEIWQSGLESGQVPRFDTSMVAPALVNLIADNKLHIKDQHVFIPGCGRGYDVVEFAKQGAASATGMELVPEAVAAAKEYVEHSQLDPEQQSCAQLVTGDFFRVPDKPHYDVGYDYTFFCAMDPAMREQWGEAWSHWLKPSGTLVTLMFPMEPEGREGPPWPVSTELYHKHLDPHGFTCTYLEQVLPEQCHKGREGKTWMALWRLK